MNNMSTQCRSQIGFATSDVTVDYRLQTVNGMNILNVLNVPEHVEKYMFMP